jgi:DNA-binding NarL/FixJ family response regulator
VKLPILPDQAAPAAKETRHRVIIIDDHPLLRRGMAALLSEQSDLCVCGEAENAKDALRAMRDLTPSVALVDINLPGANGLELIKLMLAEQPKLRILVVSMHDETLYALRSLRAGAKGYLMKSEALEQIVNAVRRVAEGNVYVTPRFSERLVFKAIQSLEGGMGSPVDRLSDRELEVLRLLGKGLGTRDIAHTLHLSVKTIETHRAHIKEKLGFKEAAEMVRFAIDWVVHEESLTADQIGHLEVPAAISN